MRFLISGALAGLLLTGPAFAQTAAQDQKPADSAQKNAPAAQAAPNPPGQAAAKPPAEPPKDDTMGNFDVTGSSANDAMGSAPP